jgi:DNA-binding IscR family transcriptional regulator
VVGEDRFDVVLATWHELQSRSEEFLKSITLALLVERQRVTEPTVNYVI